MILGGIEMKIVFAVILLFVMADSSGAVVDPDPNSIGVYFDQYADVNYMDVAPNVEFSAYVILTNPTWDFVQGVEFSFELEIPAGMEGMIYRLGRILPPTTMFPIGDETTPLGGYCIFGMGVPYPTSAATVLVEWVFLMTEPMTIEFYLGPSPVPTLPDGLPVIENENNELMSLGVSSGDVAFPVAEVNTGHQPVGDKSVAWGGVKSLFR